MACFPCSSTPQFPSVPRAEAYPDPDSPETRKTRRNAPIWAHFLCFSRFLTWPPPIPSNTTSTENTPYGVFSVFVDPSDPLNFPSNTTNTSIWTCLSCSRVPSSPTKNPLAEHIKHACISVFYVFGTLPSHRPFYSLPLPVNNKNAPK